MMSEALMRSDALWWAVGAVQWGLALLLCFLLLRCATTTRSRWRTLWLVCMGGGWLALGIALIFVIPNETAGSYADVYRNQAVAHFSVHLLMAMACIVAYREFRAVSIAMVLFFGITFAGIGGKGIGDALAPQRVEAKVELMSYSSLSDGRLRVGIDADEYEHGVSDALEASWRAKGFLDDVREDDHRAYPVLVRQAFLRAPYSSMLYLPEEADFTPKGKRLHAVLWLAFGVMLLGVVGWLATCGRWRGEGEE